MTRTLLQLALVFLATQAADANTLQLSLVDKTVQVSPGQTGGWSFNLTWSSNAGDWISFISSNLANETNSSLGTYLDFIGGNGGNVDFAVAPNTSWNQTFDAALLAGIGSYKASGSAALSSQDNGNIVISYAIFDGDPLSGGTQLGDPLSVSLPFTVQIGEAASAPEPGTALLCVGAILLIVRLRNLRIRILS